MHPRAAARAAGNRTYFTGAPCTRGHVVDRCTSDGACTVCHRAHHASWRAADPERETRRKSKWFASNKDRSAANKRRWLATNRARMTAVQCRRHAEQLKRTPAWADQGAITDIYAAAAVRRAGGERVNVDHVYPLQGETVSGLHVHNNLRVIDAGLNFRKRNRYPCGEADSWS